ncbi:MAG: hypothetical protein ACFHXK_09265 [bacterium]
MRYTDLPKNNTHFKVRLRACLAVVIVLCTGTNYALDLVKPITIPTESLLAAQDAQSVLKNIYFARHHRIVRLDPEVLMQESEFKVSLFDGEEIRLRTSSITPTGIHVEWKGELVDQYTDLPPAIIDPESGEQITGKEAEALWQAARELQLRVVSWDVDQDTGLIAPQGQRVLADAPTIRPSLRRNVYTTIEGSLKLHSLGKTIVFKNIPEHPDLQLMYEVNEHGRKDSGPNQSAEILVRQYTQKFLHRTKITYRGFHPQPP